jgi:hypothetical protein
MENTATKSAEHSAAQPKILVNNLNFYYGNALFAWDQLGMMLGLAATVLFVPWPL